MESSAVALVGTALSTAHNLAPSFVRNWKFNPYASYTVLASGSTQKYYLREDNASAKTKINVFDGTGKHLYSFERGNSMSTKWVLFSAKDRTQVAAVTITLRSKSVSYLQKHDLKYQNINGLLNNSFNLNDGTACVWTRESRKLERVINSGGGYEESHQQLAKMSLLRRFRFDWELQVDQSFDPEVAICTAFVAANTIWSRATSVSAPSVQV